jgi:hypothetical protein
MRLEAVMGEHFASEFAQTPLGLILLILRNPVNPVYSL